MSQVYNVIFGINPELEELHAAFNQEIQKIWADYTNVEVMGKYGLGDKSWFTPPPEEENLRIGVDRPEGWARAERRSLLLGCLAPAQPFCWRPLIRLCGRGSCRLRLCGIALAMEPLLRIVDLHKSFGALEVLKGISIEVKRGEKLSIIGPSGSGKTTLLRCVNYLEEADFRHVYVDGTLIGEKQVNGRFVHLSDRERARARRRSASSSSASTRFHLSALDNVTVAPRRVLGIPRAEAERRQRGYAREGRPGPQGERVSRTPARRPAAAVAIACVLAMQPKLMLFDEATSAL